MEVRRIKSDELYHHGIKGQKWGVRRYQNYDGTLTGSGRKRYLDENGLLTKEGRIERDKYQSKAGKVSKKIANKAIKKDPDLYKKYKEIHQKDQQIYKEEREKWLKQTDYKGLDYYQFKDTTADRYWNSKQGKEHQEILNQIRDLCTNSTKEALKSTYDRTLNEIERTNHVKTYGEDIANKAVIRYQYDKF